MSLAGRLYTQAPVTRKRDRQSTGAVLFADAAERRGAGDWASDQHAMPEGRFVYLAIGPAQEVLEGANSPRAGSTIPTPG